MLLHYMHFVILSTHFVILSTPYIHFVIIQIYLSIFTLITVDFESTPYIKLSDTYHVNKRRTKLLLILENPNGGFLKF